MTSLAHIRNVKDNYVTVIDVLGQRPADVFTEKYTEREHAFNVC
jgi:hypothetical protein